MIYHLRGTSGSGKTYLARLVMELYEKIEDVFVEGRKRPLYTTYAHPEGGKALAVLGHYETACGGCDTIADMDTVFGLTKELSEKGYDVLMEGLLSAADVGRSTALSQQQPYIACFLDTPLEKCLEQVNARRQARFDSKDRSSEFTPVNPKNTESKYKGVQTCKARLRENGVSVITGSVDDLFADLKVRLGH